MPASLAIPVLPESDVFFRNGKSEATFTVHTTLEALPGYSTLFGIDTIGEELAQLFGRQPDLPGVILLDEERLVGVISQAHFYKCISRAFGRELYYRRPATLMLAEMKVQP